MLRTFGDEIQYRTWCEGCDGMHAYMRVATVSGRTDDERSQEGDLDFLGPRHGC